MSLHLTTGKVNIGQIQETSRNNLLLLLEKCDGTKAIVWDEKLAGPVGLITEYTVLKENDVVKMYPLTPDFVQNSDVKNVIFITRPCFHLMDIIADYVQSMCRDDRGRGIRKEYHIFFVPRKSLLCRKRLENKGVFGNFTYVEEFTCNLYPFDNDLLSMEIDTAFKDYQIDKDPTCLYQVAESIMSIQNEFGVIHKVNGKGAAAQTVWNLVKKLSREQTSRGDTRIQNKQSCIDQLLLIDRSVDLISPLATQLTYEGLIDELFGINNTTAHFPAEKFGKSDGQTKMLADDTKPIILNSSDELFAEIRDKNFNGVGPTLSKRAKSISAQYEERHRKNVQEMRQFVEKLPHLQALKKSVAIHTTIAELIQEKTQTSDFLDTIQVEQELLNGVETDGVNSYIEDCIACKKPLLTVLRLLCLQSLANSGFKARVLDQYKKDIVQTYGLQHILTLNNLEKAGLLKIQQSSRPYIVLRKTFQLIVEDSSEVEPTDVSFVHSIYAPITARLAQHMIKPGGWKNIQDVLGLLPGSTFEEFQTVPTTLTRRGSRGSLTSQAQIDVPRVVLVFFIGGCTFAEISALRFLSQQEDSDVEFIVATTKLINGNTFLKSLIQI